MSTMDQTLVTRIVEAALLAANQPLGVVQLHGLFPLDEPAPDGSVEAALAELQAACAERGVELVELASGWRFQVKADVHPWVARLWTERQTKYTRATLETLALIAYRQPITRGEIEQVRGVAVSSNIIKALEEREWIRVVGHRDVPGKPELLATTRAFLDYFGLKRLDELPPLSELKDLGELEPQLPFAPAVPAGIAAPDADAGDDADAPAGDDTNASAAADPSNEAAADTAPADHAAADDISSAATPHDNDAPTGDDADAASSEQNA
jgi:segregation and condensation protein B